MAECQMELQLAFECFCFKIGAVNHDQLTTHDNRKRLEEREAQGQQRLKEGASRTKNNGIFTRSHIWLCDAGGIKFKVILKQIWRTWSLGCRIWTR